MSWKSALMLGLTLFSLPLYSAENNNASSQEDKWRQPAAVMGDFAKRHANFKREFFADNEERFAELVRNGQAPRTLFIGCSDSRFIPELITSSKPGELFVIRTAGNFVPTFTTDIAWDGVAATIQYAVEALKIKDIIVCGHSHCGAIQGLFAPPAIEEQLYGKNLVNWLQFGTAAKQEAIESAPKNASQQQLYTLAEKASVLYQLDHLLTYPFIKKAVEAKQLNLHGWYYTIETGDVEAYLPSKGDFVLIERFTGAVQAATSLQ